jgi:hypothetical protein
MMYAFQLATINCLPSDEGAVTFSVDFYIETVGSVSVTTSVPEGTAGPQISDAVRAAVIDKALEQGITLNPDNIIRHLYITG